jgi:hypothetical protein
MFGPAQNRDHRPSPEATRAAPVIPLRT